MPHWVIQANLFREDGHERLLDALARLGISHSVHKVIPFTGILEPPEPTISDDYPLLMTAVVIGSYTLCRIAVERRWRPGAFVGPGLDFEVQVQHWSDILLNTGAHVCAFGDVPEQARPFFLRPTLDSKAFSGNVYDWPEFVEWRDKVLALSPEDGWQLNAATRVMVCPRREIWTETRFWIIDGRVVTSSRYKIGTRVIAGGAHTPDCDPVAMLAERVAGRDGMTPGDLCAACGDMPCRWQPHRAYCLDIAETPDGPRIIEVNCLNASGFYGADLGKLVYAIERM